MTQSVGKVVADVLEEVDIGTLNDENGYVVVRLDMLSTKDYILKLEDGIK